MSAEPVEPPLDPPQRSASTTDACRMCMPLGACLAFTGIRGTVPFLHGSQGCATYIRRYLISHFNEPMDVASSSFTEAATIFGGEPDLREGIANVTRVYTPELIGVATTCLTETIGEDVPPMLRRICADPAPQPTPPPRLVAASTPSYAGTHADGYQAAVAATVAELADGDGPPSPAVAVLPGIVSTADLRHLRECAVEYGVDAVLLPDWSDRLDGPSVARYDRLPAGGTPPERIAELGRARGAISLGGLVGPGTPLAGEYLAQRFGIPHRRLPLPIGLRLGDAWHDALAELAGTPGHPAPLPPGPAGERGRLVDAYVDGHKYLNGATAAVYGDDDLVLALACFLAELGVTPVLCAGGGRSGRLEQALLDVAPELAGRAEVVEDSDFARIGAAVRRLRPDLVIGHSKGYRMARDLGLPLIRVGLPIHDRLGGQRLAHVGYRGTQQLFDRVVNTVIARRQDASPVGHSYM